MVDPEKLGFIRRLTAFRMLLLKNTLRFALKNNPGFLFH